MYRNEEELQAQVRELADGVEDALMEIAENVKDEGADVALLGVAGGLGAAIAILIGEMSLRIENIEALMQGAVQDARASGYDEGYSDGFDDGYVGGHEDGRCEEYR